MVTGHSPHLFRCEFCPKVFKSKALRSAHMSTHTEERRYQCHLCALRCRILTFFVIIFWFLRFKTVGNLTAHLASCHDPAETGMMKKFSCKFCSKTFRFPAQVKRIVKSQLTFHSRSSNTNESTPKRSPSIVSIVVKDSRWSAIWRPILKLTKAWRSVVSNVPNAVTRQPLFHF